jgi:hypothetical protein
LAHVTAIGTRSDRMRGPDHVAATDWSSPRAHHGTRDPPPRGPRARGDARRTHAPDRGL